MLAVLEKMIVEIAEKDKGFVLKGEPVDKKTQKLVGAAFRKYIRFTSQGLRD